MRTNNTTAPAFGTRLAIGDFEQYRLASLPIKVLDGIILTGHSIKQNGIDDTLALQFKRKDPLSKVGAVEKIVLDWSNPDNSVYKQKILSLKNIKKKTPTQIKKTLQKILDGFQPKALREKAKKPERESARETIKFADMATSLQSEIETMTRGKKPRKAELKAQYLINKYGFDDQDCYK